jgi:hypothetical protein
MEGRTEEAHKEGQSAKCLWMGSGKDDGVLVCSGYHGREDEGECEEAVSKGGP